MESGFSTFKTRGHEDDLQDGQTSGHSGHCGHTNPGFHADTVQINVNNNHHHNNNHNNYKRKGRTNDAFTDEEFDRRTVSTSQSYNEINILRPPNKDVQTDKERIEIPWEDLTACQKATRITLVILKLCLLLMFLYLFVCSLDFLSSAFRLLAGRVAGSVFRESELLNNPVCGVMIGVLATVLVQSSSTTTSIVVSMVSAGNLLDVKIAIYILMGANIGTSVTNTIVAMGQITNRQEFRRAFSGATVHDMFNWLTVIIFLPIEVITGYLYYLSEAIVDSLDLERYDSGDQDLLKAITKPFTSKIIQVDENAISDIAEGKEIKSLLKTCCKTSLEPENKTAAEYIPITNEAATITHVPKTLCENPCNTFVFMDTGLTDAEVGVILLIIALLVLCLCLFAIVKTLNSLLRGKIRKVIKKFVNAEFPGKFKYFTGYLAIAVGCGLTILVQSSSIFTSTMTPLVGVGVIKLDRMYPLTLGSNIGTTTTAMLAALAGSSIKRSLQAAFCHLFFNLSGIIILYPIPVLRFPIPLAKFLGRQTAKYRWFAIAYLIVMFFLFPSIIFGLSVAGWYVLAAVMIPFVLLLIVVLTINILQNKKPNILPKKFRNWRFVPVWFRSLKPYDNLLRSICPSCKLLTKSRRDNTSVDNHIDFTDSRSSINSVSDKMVFSRPLGDVTSSINFSAETVYSLETRNQSMSMSSLETTV